MIWEKQDLLAPLRSGMLQAPHPMVEGTTDTDYYRGEVNGSTPGAGRLGRRSTGPTTRRCPAVPGSTPPTCPGPTAAVMAATVAAATRQGTR